MGKLKNNSQPFRLMKIFWETKPHPENILGLAALARHVVEEAKLDFKVVVELLRKREERYLIVRSLRLFVLRILSS